MDAGYSVGGLQISFEALDKTSSAFNKLKENLELVKEAIKDFSSIDSKALDDFDKSINSITKSLSPLLERFSLASSGVSGFNSAIRSIKTDNLTQASKSFEAISTATQEASENLNKIKQDLNKPIMQKPMPSSKEVGGVDEIEQQLIVAEYRQAEAAKRNRIEYLQAALALGKAGDMTEEYQLELKQLTETEEENEKATKKSNFSILKLFSSIKRVAVYRLIRFALKSITSSFQETVQTFAEIDDGVNNTMSSIVSSANVIKLSFGTSLIPLLNSIEPIINNIAISFANFANSVNASLSKTGEFTKINVKALIDYRSQLSKKGGLLDIDKFSSLNKSNSLSEFLEQGSKVEDFNKELENTSSIYQTIADTITTIGRLLGQAFKVVQKAIGALSPILNPLLRVAEVILSVSASLIDILDSIGLIEPLVYSILGYLGAMGAMKIINWIADGSLINMLKNLRKALTFTKDGLLGILATQQALQIALGALTGAIAYFIYSWKDLSNAARALIPILSALTAAIAGVAVARAAAAAGIAAPIQAGITAAALAGALALVATTAISKALGFANGGLPQAGTMFYAGESGAEFVYNMPSGQTGVANIDQIETAMYNALVRYGRNNQGGNGAVDVYIDGEKVFQATRRRANSKGLDFARK